MQATAPPRRWWQPSVVAVALLSIPVGFAQFGPSAALADIAEAFGTAAAEDVERLALSGGTIGAGYAIIRLASLGSLLVASAADRHGRRRVLLGALAAGLCLTAAAALAPTFWGFVIVFALGRPFLSATNALAGVTAAEHTDSANRATAIVLVAIGYSTGTGLTVVTRLLGGDDVGFRALLGLAILPVALLPLAAKWLAEPDRFAALPMHARTRLPGRVPRERLGRLVVVALLTAGIGFVTGPANTYVFGYGEAVAGVPTQHIAIGLGLAVPLGALGLLVGRWGADRIGRRLTAAFAMTLAALGGIVIYSGPATALVIGYPCALAGQAAFGPAAGALDAELFATDHRATVAGWLTVAGVLGASAGLLVFGLLWDVLGFATTAATLFGPVAALAWMFLLLPETRGRELDT